MAHLSVIGADLLFASPGWAHDLGNSLQAGALHAEVLKLTLDNADSVPRARALSALQDQLQRIHQLVAAWVELTVPGMSGDLAFDLRDLLRDLALLVTVTLRHRGLTLELSSSVTELPVSGDRFALLHACLCLVAHVVDTASEGGRLTISPELADHRTARCSIMIHRSAGTGNAILTSDSVEAIGVQGANELGPRVAFARLTMEQHQGCLGCWDVAQAGSAFVFTLPLSGSGVEAEVPKAR